MKSQQKNIFWNRWSLNQSLLVLNIILLDQLLKYLVLGSFLLAPAFNPGVSFGLFPEIPLWLIAAAWLIVFSYWLFLLKRQAVSPNFFRLLPLSFLLAGGLSNFIDRMRLGFVIDYLSLGVGPSFNLADVAISTGVILLVVVRRTD